jgi:hypothetical protein
MLALLFADDTACLLSGPELNPPIQKANKELQKLSMWFRANKVAVNVSKTKYIMFKPKGKKAEVGENNGVLLKNNDVSEPEDQNKIFPLERTYDDSENPQNRSFKLLGVLLDKHLSFNQHCTNVCNKLAQANYIINRVKNVLPKNLLKTLYYSLFHPHLLYCLPVFGCTSSKNVNKIMIMQKKAIRAISKEKRNAHTADLFKLHTIFPIIKLIMYSQGLSMHSIVHKYGPSALHNQWMSNADRMQDLELRNAHDLYLPLAITDQVKKLTFFALAKNWNSLPYDKLNPNPVTFKTSLREYLNNL